MATSFLYTKASCRVGQLAKEIKASTITVALDGIDYEEEDLVVNFKSDLSAGEETTLNDLVTAHTPEMVPKGDPEPVLIHEINAETQAVEPVQYAFSEGRNRVLASTKPVVPGKILYFYWSGISDDVDSDPADCIVGDGEEIIATVPADTTLHEIDLKFGNFKHGELVYLAGGAFQWADAEWGDCISLYVMASATPTQQLANLDFNVVDDKLVATAPGTGTHGLAGTPVFVPNYAKKGWWNLTADLQAEFSMTQEGAYDWWTIEKPAAQFVNKLPIFGTETKGLQLASPETSNLPAGYYLKLCLHTGANTSSHEWKVSGSIMLFREHVGNP